MLYALRGILQGAHDFESYAVSTILESVARTVLGAGAALVGMGVRGAMSGYAAGSAIALVQGAWKVRDSFRPPWIAPHIDIAGYARR